ncbi:hypothetical protein [Idiomarina aquatica]|nr:hypothetical protein [Idiomarina aquatica]
MLTKGFSAPAPSHLYFADLTNKSGGLWIALQPVLENQSFPAKESIEFETQDGFKVSDYLINGGNAERPLMVMPHDEPASHDSQVFSTLEYMFFNAGYAV